jgi:hypothetical protein
MLLRRPHEAILLAIIGTLATRLKNDCPDVSWTGFGFEWTHRAARRKRAIDALFAPDWRVSDGVLGNYLYLGPAEVFR